MAAKIPVGPLKLSIQPGNGSFQDAPTMDGRTTHLRLAQTRNRRIITYWNQFLVEKKLNRMNDTEPTNSHGYSLRRILLFGSLLGD